ncbi:acyltransferase family protein [Candidatus Electronema sp. PJ]|uniref:acyltransferase family protein n=1 Tax=Candidatus Electronema sp. PJ TaxID=3401572 RepID=UPI003AA8DB06
MMHTRKNLLAFAASMLVFAALFAVCKIELAGADFLEVLIELDHRDRLQVFYAVGGGDFTETNSVFSEMIEPGQVQKVRIRLHHAPARKLRLDLGEQPGTVQLHQLTVAGSFAEDITLQPTAIFRLFKSQAANTVVQLKQDWLEVQTSADSFLVCTSPLLTPKPFLLWGLPLLFSLLFFLLIQQIELAQLAPLADLRSKQPSLGENIAALDGLRGLAMLMVVADHTWGWFSGVGRSGVWIFMSLSGFLLARPFVRQPERALSLSCWQHFFLRRMQRILPVYYAYILVVFFLHGRLDEAMLHFFFLKGSGHLWVVPQEMIFYLLTPPLMLISLLLFRIRPWLVLPGLLVLILLANHFAEAVQLHGGLHDGIPLYFGVFLGGVLAAWLHSAWQQLQPHLQQQAKPWAAGLAGLIVLVFVLFSHQRNWGGHRFLALHYFPYFAAAAAGLILAVLASGQTLPVRWLSWTPLRAISLVSFSIYLWHPLLLEVIRKGAVQYCGKTVVGFPFFLSTLLLSYCFACGTYTLLERPFLHSS